MHKGEKGSTKYPMYFVARGRERARKNYTSLNRGGSLRVKPKNIPGKKKTPKGKESYL